MIFGEPRGKGRPRVTRRGTYTPKITVEYENRVITEYKKQCEGFRFPDDAMLDLRVIAYYGIAKRDTKKIKQWKQSGECRPTKKPDGDNVLKIIADALNDVAYRDDTQIVDMQVRKYFSDEPRVEVRLIQVGSDPTKRKV